MLARQESPNVKTKNHISFSIHISNHGNHTNFNPIMCTLQFVKSKISAISLVKKEKTANNKLHTASSFDLLVVASRVANSTSCAHK